MGQDFLDKVYKVSGAEATRDLYDAWSDTYDAELSRNRYVTPQRCAEALRQFVTDPDEPVLDIGCGTGMSGLALLAAGFRTIDGLDLSPGMVRKARAKGIYRMVDTVGADDPLPTGYKVITAIGMIGSGAAPITVLDRIVKALPPGGMTVFSFNDHTLENPAYQGRVDALLKEGMMVERFREYGDHLPGQSINSTVYVLEKS